VKNDKYVHSERNFCNRGRIRLYFSSEERRWYRIGKDLCKL